MTGQAPSTTCGVSANVVADVSFAKIDGKRPFDFATTLEYRPRLAINHTVVLSNSITAAFDGMHDACVAIWNVGPPPRAVLGLG